MKMKGQICIPLTCLLLAPAIATGLAYAQDIPVQEGEWITATAGGKKDSAHIMGCSAKNESGDYIVAKCTEACTSKFWRWRFWATRYKISRTLRQGEHQGIWIYGQEYRFDKRFLAKDGVTQPWLSGNTEPFLEQIIDPKNEEVTKYAMCDLENVVKTVINNHGRTLATVPPVDALDLNITGTPIGNLSDHAIGPLDYSEWSDPKDSDSKESADITQCLINIHDGYCDSICGNCSYVLPPDIPVPQKKIAAYKGQTFLGWKAEEGAGTTVKYTKKQTTKSEIAMVLVPTPVVTAPLKPGAPTLAPVMRTYRDDFTHCVIPGTALQQTLLIASLDHLDGVVSGLYGHNSNTDAEAEFLQFEACIKDPSVDKRSSCDEICGDDKFNVTTRRMEQSPCLDTTNEAKQVWGRSMKLPGVDDSKAGTYIEKPPYCLDDPAKPVRGM